MTKMYIKLIAMTLALILSASVVVMSSYAWLVLSGNPAATGIQVAIGGGNTILTAPDVTIAADGKTYHIPGHFSDKMNFGQQDQYAYLEDLGNLTPVSTSNGIDWFLPTYYNGNDELVQQGRIPSGALKDVSEFRVDSELSHANLPKSNQTKIDEGNYVYLDFWVVSPGGDYKLRVSTGERIEDSGSFVIDLLDCEKTADGYTLKEQDGSAAAAVRVGFLANDLTRMDDTMQKYQESRYFDNRFTALRGMYQEPNTGTAYLDANRFTIYEPNGDYHPDDEELDGTYVETKSLELENGKIQERQRGELDRDLTVQRKSTWAPAENGADGTAIEQRFQAAQKALLDIDKTAEERLALFYGSYLQGQLYPYVEKGRFIKFTQNLIGKSTIPAETLDGMEAGATEDVYIIELERNVPQRIRMFIWLEGQDMDCVDSVNSARFAVNIELAGGDH